MTKILLLTLGVTWLALSFAFFTSKTERSQEEERVYWKIENDKKASQKLFGFSLVILLIMIVCAIDSVLPQPEYAKVEVDKGPKALSQHDWLTWVESTTIYQRLAPPSLMPSIKLVLLLQRLQNQMAPSPSVD